MKQSRSPTTTIGKEVAAARFDRAVTMKFTVGMRTVAVRSVDFEKNLAWQRPLVAKPITSPMLAALLMAACQSAGMYLTQSALVLLNRSTSQTAQLHQSIRHQHHHLDQPWPLDVQPNNSTVSQQPVEREDNRQSERSPTHWNWSQRLR